MSTNYHVTPHMLHVSTRGEMLALKQSTEFGKKKTKNKTGSYTSCSGTCRVSLNVTGLWPLFLCMKKGWGRTTLNHSPGAGVHWDTEYEWGVRQIHKYKRPSSETVEAHIHSLCLSHQKRLNHPSERTCIPHPNLVLNQSVSLCLCSYLFQLLYASEKHQ